MSCPRPACALWLLVLFIGWAAPFAWADANPHAGWAALEALMRDRPAVTTYRAAFTQNKYSPLLNEPIVSTGRVQMAGGVARWDTDPPHPTVMVLHQGALHLYYPQQQTAEVYDLGDRLDTMATSPVPDIAVLSLHFEPQHWNAGDGEDLFEMTLAPKSPAMRDAVELVEVAVDPRTGTLDRFTLTDLDGEITEMIFINVELNPELDPEALKLDLPAGTRVVRPLDAVAP